MERKFLPVSIALLTVSDTRVFETDKSGNLLANKIEKSGHILFERKIVKDEILDIQEVSKKWIKKPNVEVIISTGGTGLTGRDSTPEAVKSVIKKEIPGFGEIFRMISYNKIATSSLQSRALAGLAGDKFIFALPGSPGACRDAWDNILAHQLNSNTRPCNLVELIPRLKEK